jgi:hypothetical protein
MPAGIPTGAMCVQRFDDSLNSAIHTTYRISLRSSSMPEPRDPLLKVLIHFSRIQSQTCFSLHSGFDSPLASPATPPSPAVTGKNGATAADSCPRTRPTKATEEGWECRGLGLLQLFNDPSAGSPTETLLRLLLPLNDQV